VLELDIFQIGVVTGAAEAGYWFPNKQKPAIRFQSPLVNVVSYGHRVTLTITVVPVIIIQVSWI